MSVTVVDAIGEQTTTIADAIEFSALCDRCREPLSGLQDDQLRAKRFERLLQIQQTVLNVCQIAGAALFFESKGRFKGTVGAESGDRAFQAMRAVFERRRIMSGYRLLDLFESGWIIFEKELDHFL